MKGYNMTHGFITIATGDAQYYKMARDLLHRGTRFTKMPLYRKQVEDLCTMEQGGSNMALWAHTVRYGAAETRNHAVHFVKRGWNKLQRVLSIK